MLAETHPTKGLRERKGWHCLTAPVAPHLSKKGRVWALVEIDGVEKLRRPKAQGGKWLLADRLRVIKLLGV